MQGIGHESYMYKTDNNTDAINEMQEKQLPQLSGVRPMVDPQAEGNVDPLLYPQPKEATHKIRGKNDIIEYLFGAVDQELLTVKTFYFFFYSAFGSLFPLMGVYFKQMGMNAGQCGLLMGLRPFIEFFSAPFWGSWADRSQKGKVILLASLSCWIIFTLPLGFIQPPATSCMIYRNHSSYLYIPDSDQKIVKRSADQDRKLSPIKKFSQSKDISLPLISGFLNSEHPYSEHAFGEKLPQHDKYIDRTLDYSSLRKKTEIEDELEWYNRTENAGDPEINLEEFMKNNRPADIRQYKKFLKVRK